MGKGTDKLYITQSEWSSSDAYSASAGSNVNKATNTSHAFRKLPFNFCSLSLQPFTHPVCTLTGHIFDLTNILPWLKTHGTNPLDGSPLRANELFKLSFHKNEDGEYVDPVTFKVFTDNTHLVALKNTGNVYAFDTVERLNFKAKNLKDLVTDAPFVRADVITLQDPLNVSARDLGGFKHVREGQSTLTSEQVDERAAGINAGALGSSSGAKILKAKEALAKARAARENADKTPSNGVSGVKRTSTDGPAARKVPYNAARHTTGRAAASLTSTGLTPYTGNERALISDEEYMLKQGRVKVKGYARMQTTQGELVIELHAEQAPRAVWNFVRLAQKGYYRSLPFHRNIKNFMIQGGDPTGTGRGGASIWNKNFVDEFDKSLTHDTRGVLSMANKGKDTNSSQFFLTYRAVAHLDRKHTIFGRVVQGMDVLDRLEAVRTGDKDKPIETCVLDDIVVFIDPFAEYAKQRSEADNAALQSEKVAMQGGAEDDHTTWTGKKIGADGRVEEASAGQQVGRYLSATPAVQPVADEVIGDWDEPEARPAKKMKSKPGGFGNFDSW